MLKKTIKYTDFNGDETSEDFLFHLSKAELIELEASHKDGLAASMQRIIEADDNRAIIAEFKRIVLLSYGKKSMDGKRFIKNQTMRDEFESSEAYSTLFMELVTNTDSAIEFMNGIIPSDMIPQEATVTPIKSPDVQKVTRAQLQEMSNEEFVALGDKLRTGEAAIIE